MRHQFEGSQAQVCFVNNRGYKRRYDDMPYKTGKALIFAVLVWIIGFVWGSIVFMTPALKTVAAIPYVSSNPAISFPILIIWLVVTYLLAKSYLKAAGDKVSEGLKLVWVSQQVTSFGIC